MSSDQLSGLSGGCRYWTPFRRQTQTDRQTDRPTGVAAGQSLNRPSCSDGRLPVNRGGGGGGACFHPSAHLRVFLPFNFKFSKIQTSGSATGKLCQRDLKISQVGVNDLQ